MKLKFKEDLEKLPRQQGFWTNLLSRPLYLYEIRSHKIVTYISYNTVALQCH